MAWWSVLWIVPAGRFYMEQYKAAVTDTMKILFMLGNLAQGCSGR